MTQREEMSNVVKRTMEQFDQIFLDQNKPKKLHQCPTCGHPTVTIGVDCGREPTPEELEQLIRERKND